MKKLLVDFPGRSFSDIIRHLKISYKMFKRFFYVIWHFRGNDYSSTLEVLKVCLEEQLKSIQSPIGLMEVDSSRIPKENKLKRAIELLNNKLKDDYSERCGYDYDYKHFFIDTGRGDGTKFMETTATDEQRENNKRAIKESMELEKNEWEEFTDILREELPGWWT